MFKKYTNFLYRQSERQVMIYQVGPEIKHVHTHVLDVSPAILIPHYDEDSSTLFLTSKVNITFSVTKSTKHR